MQTGTLAARAVKGMSLCSVAPAWLGSRSVAVHDAHLSEAEAQKL